jgi:hypothetical protein
MAGEIIAVGVSPNSFSRNAIDVQVSHTDVNSWNPPGGGSKTVEYSLDGGANWLQAGFWTPTDNVCPNQSSDFNNVGGTTSSTLSDFTIYAPDNLPHATLVRVRVRANTVDGDFTQSVDTRTRDYPTFVCTPSDVTATTATLGLADDAPTGQTNVAPCGADTIVWEYGTTPGGPYPNVLPSEAVTGYSPTTPVAGLTPGTTYYYRARLSEVTETNAEYLVTQECSFATTALAFNPECDGSAPTTTDSGTAAGTADDVPTDHAIVLALGTAPGGPYSTLSPATPGDGTADQTVSHTFTGLAPSTTYYFRTEVRDAGSAVVDSSAECSFTTLEDSVTTPPPFQPLPCDSGGAGADAVDVEQTLLCDTLPDGTIAGTAMAVWEYDTTGNPAGPPTFVDPATGDPYVAQGTLMPCPGETGCLEPVAFHRTTTATGPVDHPGRQYDITLPINPGFAVQSLQVDQVTNAANIVWDVADPDGEQFRQDLTAFIEGRVPAAATVTITNPNAGVPQVCGAAQPMQIHIECIRLDQNPPDLIELIYNGGQDMVQNPAYNESPPLSPPVSQGNYGFHLLAREDDPGPFPGNPPSGRALCTNTPNQGWETNDIGRTFEIWGKDVADGQNTTPTPRGTPVQEITSDGPPPGGRSTIWQTFTAPASGNFIIRVVHGARDAGEQHRITLDNGDTGDAQNGDLIDDISNPPSVTSSGGPNPWTQFTQTIPLNGGSTYTLALSTNNPAGGARGGLFTDMRAYIDRPDLRATATTDDDTCVVTVDETTTVCEDELWSPICEAGTIESWQNAETGEILSNSAFWGQAPAPTPGPCPPAAPSGAGGSVAANLVHTYPVCATVGGVRTNLQRVVITDASGGVLADSFIGSDGGPVPAPSSYDIGSCTDTAFMGDQVLCDDNGPFLRKYVQDVNDVGQPQIKAHGDFTLTGAVYTPVGRVGTCAGATNLGDICYLSPPDPARRGFLVRDADGGAHVYDQEGAEVLPFPVIVNCPEVSFYEEVLCDQGNDSHPFIRRYTGSPVDGFSTALWNLELDGSTVYEPVGPVGTCGSGADAEVVALCDFTGDPPVIAATAVGQTPNPPGDAAIPAVADVNAWVTGAASSLTVPTWGTNPPTSRFFNVQYGLVPPATAPCGPPTTIHVKHTFSVRNTGQGAPSSGSAVIELRDGPTVLATRTIGPFPSGTTFAVTLEADIPYADLAAGQITVHHSYLVWQPTTHPTYLLTSYSTVATDAAPNPACISDDSTPLLRHFVYGTDGSIITHYDTTYEGSPYTVTGTVGMCQPSTSTPPSADSEPVILCDSAAIPNRFIRTYTYDAAGTVTGFTDTTLAGAAFVPTGAVGVCAQTVQSDTDFVEEVLCDSNGTAFIRLFRFNSTTGALISTTNTTLAGGAFVPVGAVGVCSECCPNVVGEGCSNTGSGRYAAVRAANGTITLIDSVSGAPITAANVVPCTDDDTARTLTAQGRLVGDADAAWTPGADVAGTLTSVTLTVLSGTATVTDADGTVMAGLPAGYTATWSVEDGNNLTGPQSIDAVAGSVAVVWTQR